jgi:VWFA-related protein
LEKIMSRIAQIVITDTETKVAATHSQVKVSLGLLVLSLVFSTVLAIAQQAEDTTTTLTVRSTLVQVPVQVKTKSGKNVFALTADNFVLTDNGVPQQVTLDDDTGSQPLALAIVVQTGGAGAAHIGNYQGLSAIIDAIVGNVDHLVAVVSFDSTAHLLQPFTPRTELATKQLNYLQVGDNGAAILDGVAFAVSQLRQQPANYRHAILLFSESIDQDSNTTLEEALRLVSDTNTTMYTFAFSSTHVPVRHEASKFNQTEPGPTGGCLSRDGADAEYDGHYSKQVLDCISQLAPPVRLATIAFVSARNSLRTNTAASIAQLTGGEFAHFSNAKDLQESLVAVVNDVPNFYLLSFRPQPPTPGMHALHVELKDAPHLELKARTAYWIHVRHL